MRYHRLCRDIAVDTKEIELALGGEMRHMQACAILTGEAHGKLCRRVACLHTTDPRVVTHVGIVTPHAFRLFHVAVYGDRVFTMGHDGQLHLAEDAS